MMRSRIGFAIAAFALGSLLLVGGCSKKQVREESETPATTQVTETKPVPEKTVRETPIKPKPAEPAPQRTAAVTPAPAKPVKGGGLAGETGPKLKRIHFDFDKSAIRPQDREILAKNAEYLLANPGVRIRIEGHCDERGTTEYNLALGERRAKSAFQYLMDLGVDPNRMSVVSYGEEAPLDPAHTEEAWAKNRRAEFVETQR